jgi:hypothetical protein
MPCTPPQRHSAAQHALIRSTRALYRGHVPGGLHYRLRRTLVGLVGIPGGQPAADNAGWMGTALSGSTASWRGGRRPRGADGRKSDGTPSMQGFAAAARCWNWQPPAWWAASRLESGRRVRGQGRAGSGDGHPLCVAVQASPAQNACVTPSVARGLGQASDPATPASPPRRKRACHGGRNACGSGGTVKLRQASAQLPHHCPPQGCAGSALPGLRKPHPRGRTQA